MGGEDEADGLLIQPDGKIVAVGWTRFDFAMARYHPDGSLDHGFGNQGRVVTDFDGPD